MDNQDLRTLRILEEIDKDQIPSQRDLAKKLNISLGLVNAFLKRLALKGYFKVTSIPRNRIKYILTPVGAVEKTRLTYLYIQHSLEYYKTARWRLKDVFLTFSETGIWKVVFFGATQLAEIAYLSLQETSIELTAVIDDRNVGGKYIWGRVKDPAVLPALSYDTILITRTDGVAEAIRGLLAAGVCRENIVTLE